MLIIKTLMCQIHYQRNRSNANVNINNSIFENIDAKVIFEIINKKSNYHHLLQYERLRKTILHNLKIHEPDDFFKLSNDKMAVTVLIKAYLLK